MPSNQDDGLGGLRDVAWALNRDEEWEWKMAEARAELRKNTSEILRHAEQLRESVDELAPVTRTHQEPTAEVALTQGELEEVLDELRHIQPLPATELSSARDKFSQALAIESGPGGRFGGTAA